MRSARALADEAAQVSNRAAARPHEVFVYRMTSSSRWFDAVPGRAFGYCCPVGLEGWPIGLRAPPGPLLMNRLSENDCTGPATSVSLNDTSELDSHSHPAAVVGQARGIPADRAAVDEERCRPRSCRCPGAAGKHRIAHHRLGAAVGPQRRQSRNCAPARSRASPAACSCRSRGAGCRIPRVPHHRVGDGELAARDALVPDTCSVNPSMLVFSITTETPGGWLSRILIPCMPLLLPVDVEPVEPHGLERVGRRQIDHDAAKSHPSVEP